MVSTRTRTSQNIDWSLVFGSAALGTLVMDGITAIIMAGTAEQNPAAWATIPADKIVDFVMSSAAVGAVGFGLFGYGVQRMKNAADAENERFLAALNRR